jgi:hypothetical protein
MLKDTDYIQKEPIRQHLDSDIRNLLGNISYLGIPHLEHKKRIQIPRKWKEILQQKNTLLLGIYSYKKDITFCLFDTAKYKDNQSKEKI